MNIAYYVVNLNSYSGAAQQALLLARNLKKERAIYIFNFDKNVIDEDLTAIEKNIYKIDISKISLFQIYKIYRLIKKNNISIFHLHVLNYFIILLGRLLSKNIVLKTTMLGADDFLSKQQSKMGKLKLFIIRFIDINIALTNKIKKINSMFINSEKIITIPNGVQLPALNNTMKENNFVFIGLVCQRKNTLDSIKYFSNHYSSLNNSKLFIIGPNNVNYGIREFDEDYYNKCLDYIKENKLVDKVIMTGLLQKNEIYTILETAKALLFFSEKEGMPNVVIEAMSYNCVPITSSIDGAAVEIFSDKKDGFVISDLANKISIETIDQILQQKLPYIHAREKFDIHHITKSYDLLYDSFTLKLKGK